MRASRARKAAAGLLSLVMLVILVGGLPAALYRLGGWPVPRAIPAWHKVAATLSRPDDGTLFLASVRCVAWLAWALFAVSCILEGYSRVRHRPVPRLPVIGTPRAVAAALIGSTFLGLLPVPQLSRPLPQELARQELAVAAAPPWPARGARSAPWLVCRPVPQAVRRSPSAAGWPASCQESYHVVTGDNLWDIAATHLGNGARWREIYALNRGRRQPDGRSLTDPNMIYPGWVLLLPRAPVPPGPRRPAQQHGSGGPAHSGHRHSRPARSEQDPGIDLPGGDLVGATLAATISAAVVAWRLHRRRAAIPRWPVPASHSEEAVPDTIARLRRAHLRGMAARTAEAHGDSWPDPDVPGQPGPPRGDAGDGLDEPGVPASQRTAAANLNAGTSLRPAPVPSPGGLLPDGAVAFGRRGRAEIPLSMVTSGGLGLTGPEADGTARALLTGLLAARTGTGRPAEVLIPEPDLRRLTAGGGTGQLPGVIPGLPDGLVITPSLTAALDHAETSITSHMRVLADIEDGLCPAQAAIYDGLVLIASVGPASAGRMRAVLDSGAPAGVTAIILGDWPSGTTCHISADGQMTAAADPALTGIEAFRLSPPAMTDMLALLRGAQGHVTSGQPRSAGQHPQQPDAPVAALSLAPGRPAEAGGAAGMDSGHAMPASPQQMPTAPRGPDAAQAAEAAPGAAVEIEVLGTPRITVRGTEISGGLRKARELLAYLALHHNGVSTEILTEALWPDQDPRYSGRQRNLAVRRAREMLRQATGLAAPKFIILASDRYQLDPAYFGVDLWRFDAALGQAGAAVAPASQFAALHQAAALYKGPVGEGTTWDWAEQHAEPGSPSRPGRAEPDRRTPPAS